VTRINMLCALIAKAEAASVVSPVFIDYCYLHGAPDHAATALRTDNEKHRWELIPLEIAVTIFLFHNQCESMRAIVDPFLPYHVTQIASSQDPLAEACRLAGIGTEARDDAQQC